MPSKENYATLSKKVKLLNSFKKAKKNFQKIIHNFFTCGIDLCLQ
jgi:hypothetical protein